MQTRMNKEKFAQWEPHPKNIGEGANTHYSSGQRVTLRLMCLSWMTRLFCSHLILLLDEALLHTDQVKLGSSSLVCH